MAQTPSHDMEEATEQQVSSVSKPLKKENQRPRSRGSTASLQSVGVGSAFQSTEQDQQQQQQQQSDPAMSLDQNGFFVQHGHHQQAAMFGHRSEDMLLQYQQYVSSMQQQQAMEHNAGIAPQHDMRPMSQRAFQDVQPFAMQYSNGMPQYHVPPQHMHGMRHHSEHYEGSPAPEDSNNENGGAKRRKGTASSLANDQELRRLLTQYQGKTLKEIAIEVQKNEGSGGKSEKAKQVFAMLWLQESCQRSNNSVRRDRVFARYTEKCANERVPTLNPASFGKLVRIIFPNVQTRRLGVRGESKYHYVDLSLFPEDDDRKYIPTFERPGTAASMQHERQGSIAETSKLHQSQMSVSPDLPPPHSTLDTAEFPAPSASFLPRDLDGTDEYPDFDQKTQAPRLDCQYTNTPTIRLPLKGMAQNLISAMPSIRPHLPGTMSTYLAMSRVNSLSQPTPSAQDTPIELPDIHTYLAGTNYDSSIAKSLFHLYRSYCIDVIDAFRKCKEKPFFNHHSAFNGKMTVPVSKLFSMECLAPWIHECDMRMYKQIIRFIAPLALQNVPDIVWGVFDRIGIKLVSHLVAAFEEKCPVHVVVAKAVPAARFVNLLKKLKGANAATLQISRMLEDSQSRTQMWLDLMVMVDPEHLLDESMPPPESMYDIQGMLKHDFRVLIDPLSEGLVSAAEDDPTSAYANFLAAPTRGSTGILSNSLIDQPIGLLERWISWLERVPQLFPGHHPQCMLDWHTRLWRSIMTQIGQGGAHSYQSWWFLENFTTQMLSWLVQMEGLLMSEHDQNQADEREQEKKRQAESDTSNSTVQGSKRKRNENDIGGEDRVSSGPRAPNTTHGRQVTIADDSEHIQDQTQQDIDDEETDAEMDEIRRSGPLDLPSIHTGLSSPIKRQSAVNPHDDSGIDLGLDIDADAEKESKKFNNRDWLLSSDPVDGGIGLGVTV